jgi:hypothetical protein
VGSSVLLVAGIPATGKSSFCRYLTREHGFTHYDLECWPTGWPAPELRDVWNSSRPHFMSELRGRHLATALDWGFPPHCLNWVSELQGLGVQLVWFSGDPAKARRLFELRGGRPVPFFDRQMAEITNAGFPAGLNARVVNTLTRSGRLRTMKAVYADVFGKAVSH